jgi:hypothetical protein
MITTGSGMEIPAINNKYMELCAECGKAVKRIGLSGIPALKEYLEKCNRHIEIIEDRWKWQQKVRVADALRHIQLRYYGITRLVPETVHLKAVERLEAELKKQYPSLDTEIVVPNQIRLMLILASQ